LPTNLDLPALLKRDARTPLNVTALLQLLQGKQDPFAVHLVDVLRQVQYAIEIIWRILKQEYPSIDGIEIYGANGEIISSFGPEVLNIKSEAVPSTQATLGPQSLSLIEGTDVLDLTVGGDSVSIGLTRNGNSDVQIQSSPSGIAISLASGGKIFFNGIQVLTNQQATIAAATGTAGAAYTATEQGIINSHTTKINDIISRLQAHGIIA